MLCLKLKTRIMSNTITLTISHLEDLLDRQKDIISETLLDNEYCEEVSQGTLIKKPIQELRFRTIALAEYPHDFNVLKKYIK